MNVELTKEQKIKILNSSDVYKVMRQILLRENKIQRDQEHVWAVCLSANNKILVVELVSLGAINETILTPMQVFRIALMKGAVSIILVHNHPQDGDLVPSEADKDTTDRMIQVGNIVNLKVIDHLIITEKFFFSFEDDGLMEELRQSKKYVPGYIEVERIRKEALNIGKELGEKKGEKKGKKDTAIKMLKDGLSIDTISKYTGLKGDEIKKLQESKKVHIKNGTIKDTAS
ncbi:MAG: JAB domain-containing protein [Candidatus Aminicenantes bacterium]|nr:MAG: JAB domain-containing protein [Candidatus Aminicenantes bacterium]